MKTGFFLQNIAQGGLDTFVVNLLNGYEHKSKKVLFCNYDHPGIKNLKKKIKTKAEIIPYKNYLYKKNYLKNENILIFFIKKIIIKFLRILLFIFQILEFKKIFKKEKIDKLLIINGGYPGGKACYAAAIAYNLFSKKKCSISFHANPRYNLLDKIDLFQKLINFYISKITKNLIFPSNSCRKSYRIIPSLNKIKKKVIYNGLNFFITKSNISTRKYKKKLNIVNMDKIISIIGIIEENKGQYFAIKIFKEIITKYKNVHLIICGDFNKKYKNFFLKRIFELGIKKKVTFIPHINNVDLIYKLSNIILIPSQEKESFSYVALESLKYKKPVVASNIGGLPEIIKNNINGFIINKDNAKEFEKKILYILNNKFKIIKKILTNKFDFRVMAKNYKKVI
jgi:glycosyltransferase involved in cell wall biosynthesis